MFDTQTKIDHEAIMREARQLRAEAMADVVRSIIAFFRRKPVAHAVKA